MNNIVSYYKTETKKMIEEIGEVITYGMEGKDIDGNIKIKVDDISINIDFVTEIVCYCNKYELSLCHVMDVIEDRLG